MGLDKRVDGNLREFKTGKCKVVHWGGNSSVHQYVLQAGCLESSFVEKDRGVLMGAMWNWGHVPSGHWQEWSQQVEGGDRSSLRSPGETTSGPRLGSPVEENIGFPGLCLGAMTLPATNAYVLTLIRLGCTKGEVSLIGGKK